MNSRIILILVLLFMVVPGFGQQRLEVEDFTARSVFQAESPGNINWMNDGQYYSALENNNIIKYSITTGEEVEVLFDSKSLEFTKRINGYSFSTNEQKILLMCDRQSIYRRSYTAEYYVFDTTIGKLSPLSQDGRQSYATFSPDGNKVGFVRENNLYYVNLGSGKEVQVTSDGKAGNIINGSTDWVYEEELSLTKAFFWSPEGDKLAYYRFDESEVKLYNLQKWLTDPLYPTFNSFKYPKAGEDNAEVNLFIHEVASGKRIEIDLGEETDIYIPRVKWTQSNDILSVIVLNRLQNNLEIFHADASTGKKSLVLSLKYDTYVDIDQADDLTYLEDGKHFLITSEDSGYKHLNLYSMNGELIRQITSGSWEVSQLIGIDQKPRSPIIYYLSTENSPMERQIYSINVNGKNKKLLTPGSGIHRVDMSNDYKYYLHYYHGTNHPLEVKLEKVGAQKEIKTITSNPELKEAWSKYDIVPKEFHELKASDGNKMLSYMLKPTDFDESKQYPVLIFQYSGPGSQNVNMGMGSGQNFYWHQLLVQHGYIVMVIDPRGTGARGAVFQKQTS